MRQIKYIFFTFLFFAGILNAAELKPYNDSNELIKDLRKNINIASQIQKLSRGDKKRYELLGKAFTLQGIMCRRSEITQFVIVQKAFEILKYQYAEANSDYIIFTEGCRSMFGLYQ